MSFCRILWSQKTIGQVRNRANWSRKLLNGVPHRFASVDTKYFVQGSAKEIKLKKPVQIAGRKHLLGSFNSGFPELLASPREGFPIFLKTKDSEELRNRSVEFWSDCFREQISLLYDDYTSGNGGAVAVLVRGLPVESIKNFSRFVKGLGFEAYSYKGGGTTRHELDEFVLTPNLGEPKEASFELHNDLSYNIDYPSKFLITCLKKAEFGGETGICTGRELTANLGMNFVEKFEKKGLRQLRYFFDKSIESYVSWQQALLTDNRSEAERFLEENGYSFEWDGENLAYWNHCAATISHPLTGEKLWFNQVTFSHSSIYEDLPIYEGKKYPSHVVHADGDEIDPDDLHKIRCASWETAVGVALEEGDLLFLDNLAVLHSRFGFEGERVVLTSHLK